MYTKGGCGWIKLKTQRMMMLSLAWYVFLVLCWPVFVVFDDVDVISGLRVFLFFATFPVSLANPWDF